MLTTQRLSGFSERYELPIVRADPEFRNVVPGYSARHEGTDDLRLAPKWNSGNLSKLQGRTVELGFTLQNANLYAFDFNWQARE